MSYPGDRLRDMSDSYSRDSYAFRNNPDVRASLGEAAADNYCTVYREVSNRLRDLAEDLDQLVAEGSES